MEWTILCRSDLLMIMLPDCPRANGYWSER